MEQIGLEGVFKTASFTAGLNLYLRGIEQAHTRTTTGAAGMGSAMTGMSGIVSKSLGLLGGIFTSFVGNTLANAFSNGTAMFRQFAYNAVAETAKIEYAMIGLQSLLARQFVQEGRADNVTQGLLMAAGASEELYRELRNIAILSPYQFENVFQTFRQSMAFGFKADEARDFTDALLNMAAGVGADASMLDRMSYNLAQVRLVGKVTRLDVRQLAMAGLDLVSVLKYMGKQHNVVIKDIDDFNNAIASGRLKWEDFASDFKKYADENFGGAAERMSRTLYGLKSTMQDVFALSMPELLGPAFEVIAGLGSQILDRFMGALNSGTLTEIGTKLGENVDAFLTPLFDAITAFMDGGPGSTKFATALFNLFNSRSVANAIQDGIWSALSTVQLGGFALTGNLDLSNPEAVQGMIRNMLGVTGNTGGLFGNADNASGFLSSLGRISDAMNVIKTALDPILVQFDVLWREFSPQITELIQEFFGVDVSGGVASFFEIFANFLRDNGPLIVEFVRTVLQWLVDTGLPQLFRFLSLLGWVLGFVFDTILNLMEYFMLVVTGDFAGAWNMLGTIAKDALLLVVEVFAWFIDWVLQWMGSSLEELGLIWAGTFEAMSTTASIIWEQIKTWWDKGMKDIKTWWEEGWRDILKFWENLGPTLEQAGRDVLQGLWDGMKDVWEELKYWWNNAVGDIVRVIESIFQISSPSKVFTGIGEQVIAGLAEGLMGGMNVPVNLIGNVAENMQEAALTGITGGAGSYYNNTQSTAYNFNVSGGNNLDADALYALFRRREILGAN
jgi:hypothetical protein